MANEHFQKLSKWIADHDELSIFSGSEVYCNKCKKTITVHRKDHITGHVQTKIHLGSCNPELKDAFNEDLCEAFLATNIPLAKLRNPVLKKFLRKYTKRKIPDESTLRKIYVPKTYHKFTDLIKTKISDQYVWVSVDETIDTLGRCVVSVILGVLHPVEPYHPYLIATKISPNLNAVTIAKIVNNTLNNFLPNSGSKLLLLVTDAAGYMLKAGKLLKTVYPLMLHVTCVAHALYRICEFIRTEYEATDKLISTFKKAFLKTPSRTAVYKQMCPSLPLPPAPVITRRATWIEAALFYFTNLESLTNMIQHIDNDEQCVVDCKSAIENPSLFNELQFIGTYLSHLPQSIKYFENQNVPLNQSLIKLTSVADTFKDIPGECGCRLNKKLQSTLSRSPDLNILRQISKQKYENADIEHKYSNLASFFHYAPLNSCDVERTFSIFKDILSSKRTSFSEKNLENVLLVNVNSSLLW